MPLTTKTPSEIFAELDEIFADVGEFTIKAHDDGTFSCEHPSITKTPIDLRFDSRETCRLFCLHLNVAFISGVREGGTLAIKWLYSHSNTQSAEALATSTINKAMKGH